jgi:hypothetical protein
MDGDSSSDRPRRFGTAVRMLPALLFAAIGLCKVVGWVFGVDSGMLSTAALLAGVAIGLPILVSDLWNLLRRRK